MAVVWRWIEKNVLWGTDIDNVQKPHGFWDTKYPAELGVSGLKSLFGFKWFKDVEEFFLLILIILVVLFVF
jgi:hypothetical protein